MSYLSAASDIDASTAFTAASVNAAIRAATSVKSVTGTTERAQAVTDWPTLTGAAISAANPVIVWRQDLDRIEVSENGTTWKPVGGAIGSEVIDTDGSGRDTVLHGLGYTPTNVTVSVQRTGSGSDSVASLAEVIVWAVSSTTITFQAYRRDTGAAFAGNAIGIYWRAE